MTRSSRDARGTGTSFLLAFVLFSPAATADLRLEQHRTFQVLDTDGEPVFNRELDEVVFIGDHVARYDTGFETLIVRSEDTVFLWLNHKDKTYAETNLTPRLEELLTQDEKECMRPFPQALVNAEATVSSTGEQKIIGDWQTEKLHIEGRLGDTLEFTDDRWVTHDLGVDLEPYHSLVRAKAALSTRTRGWIDQLLAEGGFPVESAVIQSSRVRRRIYSHRLQNVQEVAFDPTRYLPPAGYTRVPRPRLDVECKGPASAPPWAKARING